MKIQVFYILLIIASLNVNAQQDLSLSINGGIGKMNLIPSTTVLTQTNYSSFGRLTLGVDLSYAYYINNFSIESGINYNKIAGMNYEEFKHYNVSLDKMTKIGALTLRTSHYLTIPLLFNYSFYKLRFGLGGSIGYLIKNNGSIHLAEDKILGDVIEGGNHLSKIDFGLNTQLGYAITDKIMIQVELYQGVKDISGGYEKGIKHALYQSPPIDLKLKNRQFMLGIKFRINRNYPFNRIDKTD